MKSKDAVNAMAALSQQTRLDVFRLLVKQGEKGLTAGEISEKLKVVQNTMSAHLATLAQAELVRRERQSRHIRYYANYATMRDLLEFLLEDCCGGQPDICNPVLDQIACHPGVCPVHIEEDAPV